MPTPEQEPQAQPFEAVPDTEHQDEEHELRYRTLAVRVEEGLHAQLSFIAQLSGSSLSEEIRTAIQNRIATAQDDPDLIARAQRAREEIEREAVARAAAIAGFMGKPAVAATAKPLQRTATTGRSTRGASKPSSE